MALTVDHKPDDPAELERITKHNGVVRAIEVNGTEMGPARVWAADGNSPGLAMSRSFGDTVAAQIGVTCEPDFTTHVLTPMDRFLIIGSDGLWEHMSNDEAVGIVGTAIKSRTVNTAVE